MPITINAGAPGAEGGMLTSNLCELVTSSSGMPNWCLRATGLGESECTETWLAVKSISITDYCASDGE